MHTIKHMPHVTTPLIVFMMLLLHSLLLCWRHDRLFNLHRRSRAIENVQGYKFFPFTVLPFSSCLFFPIQPKLLFIYSYASECGKLGHFKAKVELWNV